MATTQTAEQTGDQLPCGIVMPISAIDGCSAEHWSEVKAIIQDSIDSIDAPKFCARLVSDADEVGVIQKRIVQGIYSSAVVVCDVSCKNPNVMFELGMRLAFDKPTVIIKDDKTDYTFDTGVIEHLTYPRDLRFQRMVEFKKLLAQKVLATYAAAQADPAHSTFLKNFGTFKVAQLHQKEASAEQVILDTLTELQREVVALRRRIPADSFASSLGTSMALLEQGIFSPEGVDGLIRYVEGLLMMGAPDASAELAQTVPTMRQLIDRPDLSPRQREKLQVLVSKIAGAPFRRLVRLKPASEGG